MARSVRDVLLMALDDLTEWSFKRFRNKITDWRIEEGFRHIGRGQLEWADRCDVVDLILSYYTDSYGPKMTLAVLESINEKQVASDLKKNLENVSGISHKPKSGLDVISDMRMKDEGRSGTQSQEMEHFVDRHQETLIQRTGLIEPILYYLLKKEMEHFVDRHREALIRRMGPIEPVLDYLLEEGLLTSEYYEMIRVQQTQQDKMRKLYSYIGRWGNTDKDILYNILKRVNGPLIRDLEEVDMDPSLKPDRVRFVNQHFMDLIREVTVVDPMLDDLLQQKLLTQKQCDEIRSNPTSQKKMRDFYKHVRAWSDNNKVILYKLLKKHNEQLIKYLDHQDNQPSPAKMEHFVDRHRAALMHRMYVIEPILDSLLEEGLLTSEDYDTIQVQQTQQNKMRKLYSYIGRWGNTDKDILYNILKRVNGPLIRDLEEFDMDLSLTPVEKNFVDRHHQDLINWVYELQPVLDSLLKQNLLTKEEYDTICSKTTPQEKMSALYQLVGGWGVGDKEKLCDSLGKYNRLLIRDLEYWDMKWPLTSRSSSISLDLSKWTPKHLLLYSLEYLLLDEFSRFKKELSGFVYDDRAAVQLWHTANADSMYISDKLITYYGDFTALDVTVQVLKLVGLMRFAEELQEDINLCGWRTPEVILVYILDKLEQHHFMQFKNNLLNEEDKRPFPPRLKKSADRITTSDLLLLLYGEQEALSVTAKILQKIHVTQLARDLENWISLCGSKKHASFPQGEAGTSKLTEESSSPKPGSSKDFDFHVDKKSDPDQSSATQTGAETLVSSKEENAQSTWKLSDLRREMECPVCIDILSDPTTLMCGHNFCMKCIETALDNQNKNNFFCPVCKQIYISRPKLKINYSLRKVARYFKSRFSKLKTGELNCAYCIEDPGVAVKSCLLCETSLCDEHLNVHSKKEEHILIEPTTSFKERKCSIHNKVLEHYCADEDVYVCSLCCIYGDHKGHQVEMVTEAAEKKKNDLRNVQEDLACKKMKIEDLLKRVTEAQRVSDTELIGKLVEALELQVPGDTSTREGQASFSVSDLIQKAEERKNQMSQKIDGIIKMCQETDPTLFLQDHKDEFIKNTFSSQKSDRLECELCGKDEDSAVLVFPVIKGMLFSLELQSAGLFRCSKTGIKFEVTRPVTIEFELESWSSYGSLLQNLQNDYEILGPLFNIKTDLEPGVVSAVYLPHCLCIKGFKEDTSCIKCAHFTDDNLSLEAPTRVQTYYVVLENPTFSPIGVLLYPLTWIKDGITRLISYHGMVLIYWTISGITDPDNRIFRIHFYLMPCNQLIEMEIHDEETKDLKKPYYKVRKPHQTGSLYSGRTYEVKASHNANVRPKMLEFRCSYLSRPYPYTEITVDGKKINEGITLSIEDGGSSVWQAEVDRGDFNDLETEMFGFSHLGGQMVSVDEHQGQQIRARMDSNQPTRRECLLKTLEQMEENTFAKFKECLKDEEFLQKHKLKAMTTSDFKDKTTIQVSSLLIRRYTENRVLHVTYLVLERIGEKQLAMHLRPRIGV